MCGIAGIVNFNRESVTEELLARMNAAQLHRGPDEGGIYRWEQVGLAHRRLSIIDLCHGRQPLGNEDNTVTIVFNGEIFNSPELRRELEQRGHCFRTETDTEVIVHLYEELGDQVATRLNGMFAFAVLDQTKRRLLLVRDRMGQKPLLYFADRDRLVFASEMGALAQHPAMPREFDLQALHHYFSLLYIPSPQTVYRNVRKLPPAHLLSIDIDSGETALKCYWRVDYRHKTDMGFKDACVHLRDLLTDAVRVRLLSDVPLGAFLSGGIDSTIIAGIMNRVGAGPVKTFTIGFAETLYDEREYARMAAAHFASGCGRAPEYHEKVVDPDDFTTLVKLARHYGEPFADASMLPTCMLSAFTREHVTVALSGDGADELFAGYNRYLLMRVMRHADLIPASIRRAVSCGIDAMLPPRLDERSRLGKIHRLLGIGAAPRNRRYLQIIDRFGEELKRQVGGRGLQAEAQEQTWQYFARLLAEATAADPVEQIMEADLHSYLPGDILSKVDIASMANSLEVRSPFMDYRLVEFAASLPLDYKLHGRNRKHILVESFRELLPPALCRRGKLGFGVPLATWFRGSWHTILRERLLDGQAVRLNMLRRERLETLIAAHREGRHDYSYALFTLLMLELFLDECHRPLSG